MFFVTYRHDQEARRPYQQIYASKSNIELVFGLEDEYDRMMRFLNLGGSGWDEMWKFLHKMETYLNELKHRQVGDIAVLNERHAVRAGKYVYDHSSTSYR